MDAENIHKFDSHLSVHPQRESLSLRWIRPSQGLAFIPILPYAPLHFLSFRRGAAIIRGGRYNHHNNKKIRTDHLSPARPVHLSSAE